MIDWLTQLFMPRWSGRCPLCGSERVTFKIRRKIPYVVDGPTFVYAACKACRHSWSFPIRVGV